MSIKKYSINNLENYIIAIFLLSLPLSETLKQITFVLLILLFVIDKILNKQKIYIDKFSTGLLILLLGNTLPLYFSNEPQLAFKWFWSIFMFSSLYLILINDFKSNNQVAMIKKFFLFSLVLGLIWGIFVWKISWGNPRLEIKSVGAPNATGTYLGIYTLFILFIIYLKSRDLVHKHKGWFSFYLIIIMLLLIALILNGSRGAYVGIFAGILYLILINPSKRWFFLISFFILSLIILIGGTFYNELSSRILDTFSTMERFKNWEKNLNCFLINPIFGGSSKICYEDPDNLFIAFLSRAGIIGLLSFLTFIYYFLKQFLENKFAVSMLLFLLTNGIFETT
ncbi:O-antigen ligase, partial [Thermodesulfovibrio sp. N1]|uniref:O-antigen ligase family protein n=1 Tax=Thermodesulfovibrio sp. N1 TaxID=1871110 RepID=UPI00083A8FFB